MATRVLRGWKRDVGLALDRWRADRHYQLERTAIRAEMLADSSNILKSLRPR